MNYALPTHVEPDGVCVDADGYVIGWKCLACSTVHLLDGTEDMYFAADKITNWQATHSSC